MAANIGGDRAQQTHIIIVEATFLLDILHADPQSPVPPGWNAR
jgi:hypothetical protein